MDDTQYPIVRGAVQLSAGSEIITDVDEEIFILYSNLQSAGSDTESSGFRGLGHLDSQGCFRHHLRLEGRIRFQVQGQP